MLVVGGLYFMAQGNGPLAAAEFDPAGCQLCFLCVVGLPLLIPDLGIDGNRLYLRIGHRAFLSKSPYVRRSTFLACYGSLVTLRQLIGRPSLRCYDPMLPTRGDGSRP